MSHLVEAMGPGPLADSTGNSSTGSVPSSRVVTVKLSVDVKMPAGVVTEMGPELAPPGTGAVRCVSESTVNVAATSLNVTAVVPVRPVPEIDTGHPTGPPCGEKVTAGAACIPLYRASAKSSPRLVSRVPTAVTFPSGCSTRAWMLSVLPEKSVVIFPPTPNDPSSEPSAL